MAHYCSATAKVKRDATGKILEAYIECPKHVSEMCDSCNPAIDEDLIGNILYQQTYCTCSWLDPTKPDAVRPPSPFCHLEMIIVSKDLGPVPWGKYRIRDIIDVQVFCLGKCSNDTKSCPDKPKETPEKDPNGNVTTTYTCECG